MKSVTALPSIDEQDIFIPAGDVTLNGTLALVKGSEGLVLFAHGSGSSRFSPRNMYVAQLLQQGGLSTLLFDLLTPEEDEIDVQTAKYRFDINLLSKRVAAVTHWVKKYPATREFVTGYFGASTGAAAALVASVECPEAVGAIVSRGGRPDLAAPALPLVKAPTLLIVGGLDNFVIDANQLAFAKLHAEKKLVLVTGATHLFEEPGTLDEVARLAKEWFTTYLTKKANVKEIAEKVAA